MNQGKIAVFGVALIFVVGLFVYLNGGDDVGYVSSKPSVYTGGVIDAPLMSYNQPVYSYNAVEYDNPEYELPLDELPENYERDFVEEFGDELSSDEKQMLLENGVVVISGTDDRFENAYSRLSDTQYRSSDGNSVPIFVSADSVMHLFHIQFNEMLKSIEVERLIPALNEFLDGAIEQSVGQYNGFEDNDDLRELSRRNVAYLCVAKKLIDPDFDVPSFVRDDVEQEISRIEDHGGFFRNDLFSMDCPAVCDGRLYPAYEDYACSQEVKGPVEYEGEVWDFQDLYVEVCMKSCYCEDYSQYVPRGHYTESEELKQYFKSMMWLGRMTFKADGDDWTRQAVLLSDAVKAADVQDLWNSIYVVTGFFAGASDDLTFYEYDSAVIDVFGDGFDENVVLSDDGFADSVRGEIRELRGPEILGGFEFDVAGNLKDTTQGMRLMGQRYAVDSHALSELVYNDVGVNPNSPYYSRVIECGSANQMLSKLEEFYYSCENMDEDKVKYWNEVCSVAMVMYSYDSCGGLTEDELYSVCRFMPSGIDVMSVLGSSRADEVNVLSKVSGFCDYDSQSRKMKDVVAGYDEVKWTENLYNSWLWMMQPVIEEKDPGYPSWMRSLVWRNKELSTALASWAELRHDTILYVKQSYTRAVMVETTSEIPHMPMQSKYYGYVEPNPELFARAKYLTNYLILGLEEQGMMTDDVRASLVESGRMMERLQVISDKELRGEALSEDDYDYIEGIDSTFNSIINRLAAAVKIEGEKPSGDVETHTSVEGKYDAFKTTVVADVHTDTNTKKVLEVASGKIDWVVVAHASKDGRVGIAIGPVFSYYEFPWDMDDRLTDEKWREMLNQEQVGRPEWVQDYIL